MNCGGNPNPKFGFRSPKEQTGGILLTLVGVCKYSGGFLPVAALFNAVFSG